MTVIFLASLVCVAVLARENWRLHRQMLKNADDFEGKLLTFEREFQRLEQGYRDLDRLYAELTAGYQRAILQSRTVLTRQEVRH